MASAFAQGFQMGSDAWDASEKMRLAKLADERAGKEFARKEKDWNTQDAIQSAIAEGQSQVGTGFGQGQAQALNAQGNSGDADFDAAVRQSAIDVGRENVQRAQTAGAMPAGLQVKDATQARADTLNRVRALDWKAGQQMEAGDLEIQGKKQGIQKGEFELKSLQRSADFDAKFDKVMTSLHQESANRLTDIQTTAQTGGMKGLVDKFGPELKKALGADVQLVGNNIVVKDAKGKPVQTITSLDKAVQALEGAAQLEFGKNLESRLISDGLFKSPQEMVQYFQKKEELGYKGREVSAKEALVPSEINKNNAAAGYYNRGGASANRQTQGQVLTEKIDAYATIMMKADPNLSRADAEKRAAQVIMRDPDAKPEMTPADITGFMEKMGGMVVRKDPNTGKPITLSQLPPAEQAQIARQTLSRSGMPGADGGGLPDVNPKVMVKPGAPDAASTPGGLPTNERQVKLKAAYDRWQEAKGPWYMPTPRANSDVDRLEREYEQALREYQSQR